MSDKVPFGWKPDPNDPARILKDDDEQKTIKRIMELKAQKKSLRGICAVLTAEGYKPRTKVWHHQLIQGVLARANRQA